MKELAKKLSKVMQECSHIQKNGTKKTMADTTRITQAKMFAFTMSIATLRPLVSISLITVHFLSRCLISSIA